MKRWLSLLVLTALVLMALQTGTAPVSAAPSAVAANVANAKLFPADTALYVDLQTSDLGNNIKAIQTLVEDLSGEKQTKSFDQLNKSLTMLLGHPATLEKDVLPWIGDHVSFGLRISNDVVNMNFHELEKYSKGLGQGPQIICVINVKDKAASDAFWEAALKTTEKPLKIEQSTVEVNGETFNVATGEGSTRMFNAAVQKFSIARGSKYVALGDADSISLMLDNLKNKKASLADDAGFTKVTNALKEDALGLAFIAPRIYYLALVGLVPVASQLAQIQTELTGTGTPTPATPAGPTAEQQMAQIKAALSS